MGPIHDVVEIGWKRALVLVEVGVGALIAKSCRKVT